MSLPSLLFISQTLPFPPDGGVNIRTYNVLRLLAEEYAVDLVCFYRRRVARDVAASVRALCKVVRSVEVFPIEQEHNRLRLLADHARSILSGRAYTHFAYDNALAKAHTERLLRSVDYSLVHLDSLDLSTFVDLVRPRPTIVVHHNVESALLRRRADREHSSLAATYIRHQARLTEREEQRLTPMVALNVLCSSPDAELLKHITGGGARTSVVPNGVDVDFFRPGGPSSHGIVSVGGTTWFPNRDAIEYFATDILPDVKERFGQVACTWVGRATESERARFASMGVSLTGYVDDIRPVVQQAACFVAPLRVGGGTRLKILDAWALGKAVVSTSIGCEGLDAIDGENILVRDNPAEMAQAITDVLRDSVLRERLERGARETAERTYAWPVIGESMKRTYRQARRQPGGK